MKRYYFIIMAGALGALSLALIPTEKFGKLNQLKNHVFVPTKAAEVIVPVAAPAEFEVKSEVEVLSESLTYLRQKRSSYQKKILGVTSENLNDFEVRSILSEVDELDREIIRQTDELIALLGEE